MTVGTRKWLEVMRFELVLQLRRKSTWFLFALFLFPLIGVTNDALTDSGNRDILFNAPLFVARGSVIFTVVALLVLAGVVGDAATRDVQTRIEPLMHTAPVGRAAYLGGRFLGAFTVAAILLAVVPLVKMLAGLLHPGLEAGIVGPLRPAAYLQSYFLLIVPNAFVATALLFALATLVRHTVGSYAGAALLFGGVQFTLDFVAERLGHWDLATLLDPTGIVALEVMSRTWSPVEMNQRLIGTEGALLWNRLLWLGVAVGVLVLAARRFQFGGNVGAVRWWQRGRLGAARPGGGDVSGAVARSAPLVVPTTHRDFGVAGRVRQTLAIARDSLREMGTVTTWLLLPLLALKIILTREVLSGMGAGTMILPTTARILEPFEDLPPPVKLIIIMFPVLLAGELIWRERDANIEGIADAAPVPDGVRFLGMLLGLWLVIVAIQALLMLTGVLTQVSLGWYDFEPALYVQILFGLGLVGPLVFALFALSVHVLANQKHVGHVLALALMIGSLNLADVFGIEHPLLLPGSEPNWRYSPISGFGPFVGPVLSFKLYWAAWALVVASVARLFWVRGVERGIRERLRLARSLFTGRRVGAVAAALGLVLLCGGFIFYNTNIRNEYRSSAAASRRLAEYEQQYGRYRGAPLPQLTATVLQVELYPDRREALVRGVHHLVNRTTRPIDTVHVAVASAVTTGEIDFGRPARATLLDDDLGHRIYVLDEPLQPGDSLRLGWQVRYAPRGFPARDISTAVVRNGSFIEMQEWIPLIGYQAGRELVDAGQRREHGLAARPAVPSLDDLQARSDATGRELVDLEVTVGTAAGQTAVAPGELVRTWTRDGRSWFQYATNAPIGQGYAVFSADYAVRRSRAGEVAIEVFHHPAHELNVERMIRGMEASLAQFTARFGPYPHNVLRFVEYPSAGGSLHATYATIWYKELFSLFDPDHEPRRIDLPFAVAAHEVAHQFQPMPARVEGIVVLSESFAWYAALGVVEEEYGAEHLQRLLGFMRESYLRPRPRADVPLLRATDGFLGYRKGPFAMYALREYVGQEKVDLAWRRLIAQSRSPEPPYATSLDLYRELKTVTPDSLQELLGDLLERNTFWELKTRQASVQQTPGGEWQVRIDVEARKVVVDTAGAETDLPMNDLIEIGVFAPAQAGEARGKPLELAMHRVRTGLQTITITVPERPASAGIDPRHLLIDMEPSDNVVEVSSQGVTRPVR